MKNPEREAIATLGGFDAQGNPCSRHYERLDTTIDLYRDHPKPKPWVIVSGGTPCAERPGVIESMVSRDYVTGRNVCAADVLLDILGLCTIGNAASIAEIMHAHGIRRAKLVTSASHMLKALCTFRFVGGSSLDFVPVVVPERYQPTDEALRQYNHLGFAMLAYITEGVESGDTVSVKRRLREFVPEYGGRMDKQELEAASLARVAECPSLLERLPVPRDATAEFLPL